MWYSGQEMALYNKQSSADNWRLLLQYHYGYVAMQEKYSAKHWVLRNSLEARGFGAHAHKSQLCVASSFVKLEYNLQKCSMHLEDMIFDA